MISRPVWSTALLLVVFGTVPAHVVGYEVSPARTTWSGWTRPGASVTQFVTCDFDSLTTVELFAGELGHGSRYLVTVLNNGRELARSSGTQPRDHCWVKFENWTSRIAYARGKVYEFRFTRDGSDSIQYYRDMTYNRGINQVTTPHAPAVTPNSGLAMRVLGHLNAIDTGWCGVANHYFEVDSAGQAAALDAATTMGIRWLKEDFHGWDKWAHDTTAVIAAYSCYADRGFSILGMLCYCNTDSAVSSYGRWPGGRQVGDPSKFPPRNLWSDSNQPNYWAVYCASIMRSLPGIKYWEVWGEPNAFWCWQDPDTAYYRGGTPGPRGDGWIDTPRERCSLYVRMCNIAESAAKSIGGSRKVVAGATYRLLDSDGGTTISSGVAWIRDMFDLAGTRFGGVENCFDVVSVHPYMFYSDSGNERLTFGDDMFTIHLDTARAILRAALHPDMELWATEFGWPRWKKGTNHRRVLTDKPAQADNLCKFFTSSIARQADPRGGYDRVFLYELNGHHLSTGVTDDNEGFGLLDSNPDQTRLPQSWAYEQSARVLTGKRCNRRVVAGDTAVDNHTRMYEFEDTTALRKRTWVCWRNGDTKQSIEVKLPVRTKRLSAESLAYSSTTPSFTPRVADDGWLHMALDVRPVFIHEVDSPERPDLRVDSVRFEPANRIARAWATNHGTKATPNKSGLRRPYPTWAVLKAEGDSLAQAVRRNLIGAGQQAEFTFDLSRAQLPDTALLSVTVNPNQTYVELGTDDNTGYTLVVQP